MRLIKRSRRQRAGMRAGQAPGFQPAALPPPTAKPARARKPTLSDAQNGFSQYLEPGLDAETWLGRGRHRTINSPRCAVRYTNISVAIEIRTGKAELFRSAVRHVGNRGGDDVTTPRVFNRHRDARLHAQIAGEPRFRQAAHATDFQIYDVHGVIRDRAAQNF